MNAGQPGEQRSAQMTLRHILDLGEDLLCLAQQETSWQTLDSQQERIVETARRLTGGQARLWLARDELKEWFGEARHSSAAPQAGEAPPTPLMCACQAKQQVCWGETSQDASDHFDPQIQPSGLVYAVAAPLIFSDRSAQAAQVLGILQVERPQGEPFTVQEIELIAGLAAQAALALQAGRQAARERWRREQLELVGNVSLEIANLRDLDEIARQVTTLILQTFNYYYVAIFTLETGQDALHFRASAGPLRQTGESQPGDYSPVLLVHTGQGIIGHVAQTGQEVLAGDVKTNPLYRHLEALPETRSEAALPLKIRERLLGVLDVQSDQPDDFDETDLLVLRALAGNIAAAVEQARLYSALRQRAAQLAALYEVSSAITSILDQEQLLDQVVNLIHERFGYPYVHLFTVHAGRRKVFFEAGSRPGDLAFERPELAYDLDDPQGLVPWVARHGETLLVNDISLEPRYRFSPLQPVETRAEMTVPLIFGGEVLGVLDVQSDRLNAFSDEDRFLFEALADHVAIAMRNANLYRSEKWRRRVADSLREVAGLLSADMDLDRALEAILVELERTLPLEVAAIWLLDQESQDEDGRSTPFLHLAAVHGSSVAELELELGLQPEEVLESNGADNGENKVRQASTWLLDVLQSDEAVVRVESASFDPLGAALGFPADYSAIAAPLRVGQQPMGVLALAHRSAGRYGSESRVMTAAFASYAAVAIENARLYEAAHDQAWVSTVLLQVAEATQMVTNLNELLATVIRITPMLAGVRACLLYILDEDGDFVPSAASGLSPEQQAEFERWRFAPGDVDALDRLQEERQPVILHDNPEDWRLTSILSQEEPGGRGLPPGLQVLVPLAARGDVLGAFLVDYSAVLPGVNLGRSLEAYFDERLAILQGIAHQTAVAADNIRLIKSQKEEAYVSVALLQVAQAVVSSNDLDEALGSIVRITPILVGVKRAAIYLWVDAQAVFRLGQAYGLQRSAEGSVFALGEFPLLDAVSLENSLFASPLNGQDAAEDIQEVWTHLPAPEFDLVETYLEEEACLLLAFPLAIKGKVLGALLVEEPELTFVEAFSSSNANRRLREKRLEIITGISQQAALAIQNDHLQREMVERERLEREMQLAREIQQAFLPHSLPQLENWELQVRWRPAREVGGDFYDVFDLPDGRIGLVMADVADKGIPAALFMTLVRTLVRANVGGLGRLGVESPAAVLERVNNLIVPDALKGMFVTVAYAVLTLETGEVQIANAGHNPPIVARGNSNRLERFEPGGMALGVMDDSPVDETHFRLDPGDFLVLYTDGMTEAFSPQGDLFGEARLIQAIEAWMENRTGESQASALLDAIDQSVVNFIGEAPISDDMTLLVIRRRD